MLTGMGSKGAFRGNVDILDHSLGGGYSVMYVCTHGLCIYVCVRSCSWIFKINVLCCI